MADCSEEEDAYHKGVVKDILQDEVEKHMHGIDPAVVALMQNNKNGLFGADGGGVIGGLILAGLLGNNRNGLFGGNNSDAAVTAAVSNPQFSGLSQQMQTLGQNMSVMQGEMSDAQRASAAEHRIDSLQDAITQQHEAALSEFNAIARNQADHAKSLADCCCEQRLATQGVNTNMALMEARLNAQSCQLKHDILTQMTANEANAVARHTQLLMNDKDAENRALRDQLFAASQREQTSTLLAACAGNGNGHGNNVSKS